MDEILSRTADSELITRPLDSRIVDVSTRSKAVIFDITPAVQRWQSAPDENYGLEVVILTPDGYPLVEEHLSVDGRDFELVNPVRRRRVRRAVVPAGNGTVESASSGAGAAKTTTQWANDAISQQPIALVYSDDAKTVRAKADRGKTRGAQRGQPGGHRRNQCRRYE